MISPVAEILLNTRRAPLNDVKVRQAIAYAIDRNFVINNIWFGYGKAATGPISSNFAATGLYTDKVKSYQVPDRIERANKLLDTAGYPRGADGVRFKIIHDALPYGEEWQRLGEYLKQVLGDVGIDVTIRYEDVPSWLKRIFTDYGFTITSDFYYQLADPVLGMHRQYLTSQIRKGTVFVNSTRYSNPKIDDLMDKGSKEPDAAKRSVIYDEIQKILVEDVPVIVLFEMKFVTVYSNKFKDVITSPLGVYASFDQAWLDE